MTNCKKKVNFRLFEAMLSQIVRDSEEKECFLLELFRALRRFSKRQRDLIEKQVMQTVCFLVFSSVFFCVGVIVIFK